MEMEQGSDFFECVFDFVCKLLCTVSTTEAFSTSLPNRGGRTASTIVHSHDHEMR